MPTPPDPLNEFLRKVAPLIEAEQPLYQSLVFACVALRQSTEWVLISGKATLGTEYATTGAEISELARLDHLIALSARLRPRIVHHLISQLRQGCVIDVTEMEKIRLSPEGQAAYSWGTPGVFGVDRS